MSAARPYARKRVDRLCRCGATISWISNVCSDCSIARYVRSRYLSGGRIAQTAVAKARRHGILADPRTLPCSDCRGIATEYDHRDYNKPLIVEPVCRGCNARRGKAIPRVWLPGEWEAYAAHVHSSTRYRGAPFLEVIQRLHIFGNAA